MNISNPYASPAPQDKLANDFSEPLSPPQSVSCVLGQDDYMAFVNHVNLADPTIKQFLLRRRVRMFLFAAVALLLSLAFGPDGIDDQSLERIFQIASVLFFVVALVQGPLARWQSRRRVRHNIRLGLYGETDKQTTVTLKQEGVQLKDSDGDGIRYWAGVRSVAVTDEYLFIYIQPLQAAILPLRCFQSEAHFGNFAKLAEELWQETKDPNGSSAS